MRLLLVEDDPKAALLLERGLEEEGFVVDVAATGDEAEERAALAEHDLVILDWLLPGTPGIEVCRRLRAEGSTAPILMLTAKDAVADRIAGLDAGADDYLVKPFAFGELLARIRALLRRGEGPRAPVLAVGDLRLDPASHLVTRGGRRVDLTPREYAILEYLMRHAGKVVSRTRLVEHVWEDETDNLTNLVDVHVSHLRKKVDRGAALPLIRTVRGRGYRLAADPE
ncbi:MAG TPA: response regulator transcription factor [Thermodesulfobacteriota bacterium]